MLNRACIIQNVRLKIERINYYTYIFFCHVANSFTIYLRLFEAKKNALVNNWVSLSGALVHIAMFFFRKTKNINNNICVCVYREKI